MKWTISHIPESNTIHIETAGEMTVEVLNQMVKEAIEASELHNSRLFLVDHRKVLVALNILETFDRPKELSTIGFPRESRIAVVVPESSPEKFRFFETVSRNRGYRILIFKDIKLAKEWLSS